MSKKEIPDSAIEIVAKHINTRSNRNHRISLIGDQDNIEAPQYFEIVPFDQIDNSNRRFYAIDGSYNSESFYNGLCIAIYAAGYICFHRGKQIRVNSLEDPIVLGKAYYPENILITNQDHLESIYEELLTLNPVANLIKFFNDTPDRIFPFNKETICSNVSKLLGFCQEILEISLILEIINRPETKAGDFILRDGTLRPLQIKQQYLVPLGKYACQKGVNVVSVTKQSAIKMELSYTFKDIDSYLQDQLKDSYPFKNTNNKKLCCWFEVPDRVLQASYKNDMFIKKSIKGGRGFGLFFAARLDYIEKLQNYDWLIVDVNIFNAIPKIEEKNLERDSIELQTIFHELTRLTQEHYILGYPYPLCEVHNFISLKNNFKEEIVARLKYSLYKDQRMDNVDIENLFLDIHNRF
jgi:hypothetical protein